MKKQSMRGRPQPPGKVAGPQRFRGQDGIATAEFSVVTLAAVGFAGLLVAILGSGEVRGMLMNLIRQAIGG